jgi:hypothetical protein
MPVIHNGTTNAINEQDIAKGEALLSLADRIEQTGPNQPLYVDYGAASAIRDLVKKAGLTESQILLHKCKQLALVMVGEAADPDERAFEVAKDNLFRTLDLLAVSRGE